MSLAKLVIGKPAGGGDATNGFMDAGTLASCLGDAKNSGWSECLCVRTFCRDANSSCRRRSHGLAIPPRRIRLDPHCQEPVLAHVKTSTTNIPSGGPKTQPKGARNRLFIIRFIPTHCSPNTAGYRSIGKHSLKKSSPSSPFPSSMYSLCQASFVCDLLRFSSGT